MSCLDFRAGQVQFRTMTKALRDENPYQNRNYVADPDFLIWVDVVDHSTGEHVPEEVGQAYKSKRPDGIRVHLSCDVRARQLIYEAPSLMLTPFRRYVPEVAKPNRRPASRKERDLNARPSW